MILRICMEMASVAFELPKLLRSDRRRRVFTASRRARVFQCQRSISFDWFYSHLSLALQANPFTIMAAERVHGGHAVATINARRGINSVSETERSLMTANVSQPARKGRRRLRCTGFAHCVNSRGETRLSEGVFEPVPRITSRRWAPRNRSKSVSPEISCGKLARVNSGKSV